MARRGGFPGGMGNMNNLMKQAQKMQKAPPWRRKSIRPRRAAALSASQSVGRRKSRR